MLARTKQKQVHQSINHKQKPEYLKKRTRTKISKEKHEIITKT